MTIIRASGLAEWLDCPARAEAKQLLGRKMPSTGRAILGKAIHKSTAAFDRSALNREGLTADETAAAAVDVIHKPDEDVQWDEDEKPEDAEKIAVALHTRYCGEIAPNQDYAAVEVECERLEITDLGITLTGTTDRVRKTTDGYAISDLKTGKQAVGTDGKAKTQGAAYQLGVYELLAERASGLPITGPAQIVGMNTGKTERGQRIGTGEVVGVREVLVGDHNSPGVLEAIAHMINAGNFIGNPRSMQCGPRYCPVFNTCKFRK